MERRRLRMTAAINRAESGFIFRISLLLQELFVALPEIPYIQASIKVNRTYVRFHLLFSQSKQL